MSNKTDIISLPDIKILVDTFYGKIREDELLGSIFNDILKLSKPFRF